MQAGCRINCEIQSRMDGDGCKFCLSGGCCGFWLVLTSGGSCFAHGCLVRLAGVCENHLPLPSVFFFFFDVARIDAVRGCDILLLIVLTANFIVLI